MSTTLLTYSGFLIAGVVIIMAFITSTTYVQLAVAAFFYFLFIGFLFRNRRIFLSKNWRHHSKKSVTEIQPPVIEEKAMPAGSQVETVKQENVGISDIDKRAFLKLIGGVGLSVFLVSLINKKVGGLFSGSTTTASETTALLKDPSGNKIYPAQSQPTDGYKISEVDDNLITYYGFIDKNGAWFVMKADPDTGSFRYCKGDTNFQGNWSNRENLKYDYYHNIFGNLLR